MVVILFIILNIMKVWVTKYRYKILTANIALSALTLNPPVFSRRLLSIFQLPFLGFIIQNQILLSTFTKCAFTGQGLQPCPKRFTLFFANFKSSNCAGAKFYSINLVFHSTWFFIQWFYNFFVNSPSDLAMV